MAKYRFASAGPCTLVLRGSYKDVVISKTTGQPIMTKMVSPVKAVFENSFFETDDGELAQMIQNTADWGNNIFWDPTSLPENADKRARETAKLVADARQARAKRRVKGIAAAKEGAIPREE